MNYDEIRGNLISALSDVKHSSTKSILSIPMLHVFAIFKRFENSKEIEKKTLKIDLSDAFKEHFKESAFKALHSKNYLDLNIY